MFNTYWVLIVTRPTFYVKTLARQEEEHAGLAMNEPLQGLAMTHIPMGATFERLVEMALMHEDKAVEKKGDQKKPQ